MPSGQRTRANAVCSRRRLSSERSESARSHEAPPSSVSDTRRRGQTQAAPWCSELTGRRNANRSGHSRTTANIHNDDVFPKRIASCESLPETLERGRWGCVGRSCFRLHQHLLKSLHRLANRIAPGQSRQGHREDFCTHQTPQSPSDGTLLPAECSSRQWFSNF